MTPNEITLALSEELHNVVPIQGKPTNDAITHISKTLIPPLTYTLYNIMDSNRTYGI